MAEDQIVNGIAVTGGIGCGKSRVCHWLASHTGLKFISSDTIVGDLLRVGEPGWSQLREVLGDEYFKLDKSLDKPRLRQAIFADSAMKLRVEGVLHPLVYGEIWQKTLLLSKEADRWCLVEVPLLYECGWQSRFEKVMVVVSPLQVCVDRLVARDKVTNRDALAALGSQMSLGKKVKCADFVIDNGGEWSVTVGQLGKYKKIFKNIKNA